MNKYGYILTKPGCRYVAEIHPRGDTIDEIITSAGQDLCDFNDTWKDPDMWPEDFEIFKNGKSLGTYTVKLKIQPVYIFQTVYLNFTYKPVKKTEN